MLTGKPVRVAYLGKILWPMLLAIHILKELAIVFGHKAVQAHGSWELQGPHAGIISSQNHPECCRLAGEIVANLAIQIRHLQGPLFALACLVLVSIIEVQAGVSCAQVPGLVSRLESEEADCIRDSLQDR